MKYTQARGVTLIELLTMIVIEVFIIGVGVQFLLYTKESFEKQVTDLKIDANAQRAFTILTKRIRNTGYNPKAFTDERAQLFYGVCGEFDQCTFEGSTSSELEHDRIAVIMNPPVGEILDCADNQIPNLTTEQQQQQEFIYLYFVNKEKQQLQCRTFQLNHDKTATEINNKTPVIADNIATLQFRYRLREDTGTGKFQNQSIKRSLTAAKIKEELLINNETVLLHTTNDFMTRLIQTVQIGILVHAGNSKITLAKSGTRAVLGQFYTVENPLNDRYKAYSSTILIQNARYYPSHWRNK